MDPRRRLGNIHQKITYATKKHSIPRLQQYYEVHSTYFFSDNYDMLVLVSAYVFDHTPPLTHRVTRMVALTEADSLQGLGSDGRYHP